MVGRRASLFILILSLGIIPLFPRGSQDRIMGERGSVKGTVKDPSGAVIPGATVTIYNPVTGFERTASTDASGSFTFTNVPFNPYHLTVTATGFAPHVQDVDLNSGVPRQSKHRPGTGRRKDDGDGVDRSFGPDRG